MILEHFVGARQGYWGLSHLWFLFKIQPELNKVFNGVPFHREPSINWHLYNPEESDKAFS